MALALPSNVDGLWLVRHPRAGSKRMWKAPDDQRPLDSTGLLHASGLVALFPEPPSALIASPTLRCVQTLQPIADLHALPIRQDGRLGPSASLEEMVALLSEEGSAGVVFCTHGEVLERFYFALGSDLAHIDGPTAQILAKGVAWRLTTSSGSVTLAIHPPTAVVGARGLLTASEAAIASLDSDSTGCLAVPADGMVVGRHRQGHRSDARRSRNPSRRLLPIARCRGPCRCSRAGRRTRSALRPSRVAVGLAPDGLSPSRQLPGTDDHDPARDQADGGATEDIQGEMGADVHAVQTDRGSSHDAADPPRPVQPRPRADDDTDDDRSVTRREAGPSRIDRIAVEEHRPTDRRAGGRGRRRA